MKSLSRDSLEDLVWLYLVANTPSYIWSRYRKEPAVVMLYENLTPDDILAAFEEIELPTEEPEILAIAYAYLVALCMHGPIARLILNKSTKFAFLQWGESILSTALAKTSFVNESFSAERKQEVTEIEIPTTKTIKDPLSVFDLPVDNTVLLTEKRPAENPVPSTSVVITKEDLND